MNKTMRFMLARRELKRRHERMKQVSRSVDPKFHTGELLMHKWLSPRTLKMKNEPAVVEGCDNSNEEPNIFHYKITVRKGLLPHKVSEGSLRRMNALEYLFHYHPKGGYQLGAHSIYHTALAFVFAAVLIWGSVAGGYVEGSGIGMGIGVAVFVLYFVGSYLQYLRVWK